MRTQWLQHRDADRLIVIFGGWALGPAPFAHLTGAEDVLFVEDWRLLDHDLSECGAYARCDLIAHSFGVAAAGHWLAAQTAKDRPDPFTRKIAINGTLDPCHEQRGIPPELVRATADQLDLENLRRFCKRAGAPAPTAPDIRALRAELRAVLARGPAPSPGFDRIWLGQGDRIFPPAALALGWQDQHLPITWLKAGHTPFSLWQHWSEVLA